MSSKIVTTDHLLFYVSRIFRGNMPDIMPAIKLLPIEDGDISIGSIDNFPECMAFYNQIGLIALSPFQLREGLTGTTIFEKGERKKMLVEVLSSLFWESVYHYLPESDTYDNIYMKGDNEIVAGKQSMMVGPNNLPSTDPIKKFYSTLARIFNDEIVFEGNCKPLGLKGLLIGRVENNLTRQIHHFLNYQIRSYRQMMIQDKLKGLYPIPEYFSPAEYKRHDLTYKHFKEQTLLVNRLLIMCLEIEHVTKDDLACFIRYNPEKTVIMIDEHWNILCVNKDSFKEIRVY